MVPFPSLPFCSLHVCFYQFGLGMSGSFITYLKGSMVLPWCHQGRDTNTIHKCYNTLSVLFPFPRHLAYLNSHLDKTQKVE